MVGGTQATERRVKNTAGEGGGGEVVLKPNTAGARCRHRKVVQNPHSVQADTHDYFLPRPGRLPSKSGPDMTISCGDLRLFGSARHRKVYHSCGLGPAARWGGVPKVAPEPPPYMVLRAVWLVALVFQKVAPELLPWPVGVLVAPMGMVFQKLGWCSKKLSQNPRWGGVPKVGVVFQKVVPESPRLDGVVFQKLGWCSKKLS